VAVPLRIRRWSRGSPCPPWAAAVLVALLVVAATPGQAPGWVDAGALVGLTAAVLALGRLPLVALGLAAAIATATGLAMGHSVPVWAAALAGAAGLVAHLAGLRIHRDRRALAVLGGVAGLDLALGPALVPEAWSTGLVVLALAVGLPWLLARSRRQQAELVSGAAERARLRERTRIADEMHDTLGHELSLLALRAGALELAADLPEHHRAAASGLRAGAGAATERLAAILAVLRDGGPAPLEPATETVDELVDRAARAGMTAGLHRTGAVELPTAVERAAHRVVQEGLTNAMKHAPGSPVTVRLTTTPDATVVEVTNPLPTTARRGPGGGAGLAGLRERLRLLGGTVEGGRRDRTYRLRATLPHPGDVG
jgi:signal transduction histidine kinase